MSYVKIESAEIEAAKVEGAELKFAVDAAVDVESIGLVAAEIDLQPISDETTQFSDSEEIKVEHVNFEFVQSHKQIGRAHV